MSERKLLSDKELEEKVAEFKKAIKERGDLPEKIGR
jgi:hypothetical protein